MVQNRDLATPFVRKSQTQTGVKEQRHLGKGQLRQRSCETLWESVLIATVILYNQSTLLCT